MRAKPPYGVEISHRLRMARWTQADLTRDLGVSTSLVNNTIHNRTTCYRVASKTSGLLNEPIQGLWPSKYEFRPRKNQQELGGKSR